MKTEMKTTREVTVELDYDDLVELMKAKGLQINGDAKFFVKVPGGGDWSNQDLLIDNDVPLLVQWTDVTDV